LRLAQLDQRIDPSLQRSVLCAVVFIEHLRFPLSGRVTVLWRLLALHGGGHHPI
jgi:hypothetical protein